MLLPALLLLGAVIWLLPAIGSHLSARSMRWALWRPCLTDRELILHRRLTVMYPDHVIFTQVALSQLIDVHSGASERQAIQGQCNRLIADFVLCRRDFSIVAVIELGDSSNAPPHRQEMDARQRESVESAGLRLVRIGTGPIPSQAELQEILQEKIDPGMPIAPVGPYPTAY
jgi:hypothetical protein